ncbi:MAG TPA: PilZ domain-containing protein [Vicinamibacteria bacterium]
MHKDERRQHSRMSLRLPVRAQGYDPDGSPWVEMTTSADASAGGTAIDLRHPVRVGQVVQLQMPLPRRFRSFDPTGPAYRVYAVVRSRQPDGRTGLRFLSNEEPARVAGPTLVDRRRGERRPGPFLLLVRCIDAGGELDPDRAEATVADNLGPGGACVKTSLSLARGDVVWVAEAGGPFRSRAEVRNVGSGRDGIARANLMFLDGDAPERLLAGPAHSLEH